jgi:hypothetical protein
MSLDRSLNKVTLEEFMDTATDLIAHAFNNGYKPAPMMLHGRAGVGKSASIVEIARRVSMLLVASKVRIIDLRIGGMDSSDLLGIPYVVNGEMKFSTPSYFPTDPDEYVILLLDEIKNASRDCQKAAYALVHDGMIHNGKRLSNRVAIIAAGNLVVENTGAMDLLPALNNRFGVHFEIHNIEAGFIKYMVNNRWNPMLIAFLSWKKTAICTARNENEQAWANPRTWEKANNHIAVIDPIKHQERCLPLLAGCIGTEVTLDFLGFLEYQGNGRMPDYDLIRKTGIYQNDEIGKDSQLEFAIAVTVIVEIMNDLMDIQNSSSTKSIQNAMNLCSVLELLSGEMRLICVQMLKNNIKAVSKLAYVPSAERWVQSVNATIKRAA